MDTKSYPDVGRIQSHGDCRTVYTDGSAYKAGGASVLAGVYLTMKVNTLPVGPLRGNRRQLLELRSEP